MIAPIAADRFPEARRVAWSPSRDLLLVFSRGDGTGSDRESIALFDLATKERSRVYASAKDVSTPVWAPDGHRFSYVVAETSVHIESVEGDLTTIDLGRSVGRSAIWSPDGQTLLVIAVRSGDDSVLIPVATGSGAPAPLKIAFDTDRRLGGAPQWGPIALVRPLGPPTYGGTATDAESGV